MVGKTLAGVVEAYDKDQRHEKCVIIQGQYLPALSNEQLVADMRTKLIDRSLLVFFQRQDESSEDRRKGCSCPKSLEGNR